MKELYLNYELFKGSEEEFLAIEDFFSKEWHLNDLIHRIDGPAMILFSNKSFLYNFGLEEFNFYFEGLDFKLLFPVQCKNKLYEYNKDNHS